jgi:hypothetical protein
LNLRPEQCGQGFAFTVQLFPIVDGGCWVRFFSQAKDVSICGVEITEGAAGVHKHPFNRSTAFVLGNEVS